MSSYPHTVAEGSRISVERQPVEEVCPKCKGTDVRRYPVAAALGPRIAIKCQDCFHVLRLERPRREDGWPPFRPRTLGWRGSRAG